MSFSDRDGVIWFDGELVPWRDAKVHVLTHSLHYGLGVFEGIRAYKTDQGTAVFRLDDHTRRLHRSAHILNMNVPFDTATTNRPGTRFGPRGVRAASVDLAFEALVYGWDFHPVKEMKIADHGDLPFEFAKPAGVPDEIEQLTLTFEVFDRDKDGDELLGKATLQNWAADGLAKFAPTWDTLPLWRPPPRPETRRRRRRRGRR